MHVTSRWLHEASQWGLDGLVPILWNFTGQSAPRAARRLCVYTEQPGSSRCRAVEQRQERKIQEIFHRSAMDALAWLSTWLDIDYNSLYDLFLLWHLILPISEGKKIPWEPSCGREAEKKGLTSALEDRRIRSCHWQAGELLKLMSFPKGTQVSQN